MSISPSTLKTPQFSGKTSGENAKAKNDEGRLYAKDIKPSVRNSKLEQATEALAKEDLQTLDDLLIEAPLVEDQIKPWHNSLAIKSAIASNPDMKPEELQRLLLIDAVHRGKPTDGFFKTAAPAD